MPTNTDILREIYEKALETLPDAVVVVNAEGRIIVCNKMCELMFGYSRVELVNQEIEVLLPDELRDGHKKYFRGYIHSPQVREMGVGKNLLGKRRNGDTFPIRVRLGAEVIEGAGTHVFGVIRAVEEKT